MYILFVADIHIKLGQKNVPTNWARDRYDSFIKQLAEASDHCDMIILGGDIFDRVPTLEEIEVYFDLVRSLNKPTLIYDGNHEATKKGKTFLSYLKHSTNAINRNVTIVDEVAHYPTFSIVPYCAIKQPKVWDSVPAEHIVFTHVRGEIPPHVQPEIDLDLLSKFELVMAGDLHSHSNSQRNIVYPGSPMTTSFHRSQVETGYVIVNTNTKLWNWYAFRLPQLIRKTVTSKDEMVGTLYDHTIYEIEGDMVELAAIANSELLDKKIVRKSSEVSLILDNTMTIRDEVSEYLQYILEIPEEKVTDLMQVFNDYYKGS
jgi:DNA repair exonuclease SbcCD nuclease subunit